MALNARRPAPGRRPGTPHRPRGAGRASYGDSLTAAAETVQSRIAARGGAGGQLGTPMQREAWELYRTVPELRTIGRLTGIAMSQCRFILARVSPSGGEPIPLDYSVDAEGKPVKPEDYNHPGRTLLAGFAGGLGGQTGMLDTLGVLLTVSGEGILVGALSPNKAQEAKDPFLVMSVYSEQQVRVQNRAITVRLDDTTQSDKTVSKDDGNEAIRIWRPDAELSWRADSVGQGALAILREIALYDEHIRASAISRLAGSGLLGIPEGMTLPGLAADDGDNENDVDPFIQLLIQVMSLAIKDGDSAARLAPILVRGDAEDIAAMRLLTFSTPFDEKVADLRERALGRLAVAADMPPEILKGIGGTQHWSGSAITEEWKGSHLANLMSLTCSSISTGWFFPALALEDPTGNYDQNVIVWFDDSSVRTRENTGPEAAKAYEDGIINASAYRRAIGFDDGDAPVVADDPNEFVKQMLVKAPAALAPLLLPYLGVIFTPAMLEQTKALAAAVGAGGTPAPPGGNGGAAGGPAPTTIPGAAGSQAEPVPGSAPATTP